MNRYEQLGCPGGENIREAIEVSIACIPEDLESLRREQKQFRYTCLLTTYFTIIQYEHYGFSPETSPKTIVDSACDLAREYYSSQWKITKEQELRRVRKEEDNRYFNWFDLYRDSLQFAFLDQNEKLLNLMGDYIEPWFGTGWHYPYDLNPVFSNLVLSVGASSRTNPLIDLEKLEAKIRDDKDEVPRLLFFAWDAARNNDASTFAENFYNSISEFERGLDSELLFSRQAIAEYHSIVFNAASMMGMNMPEFEPRIMARLITPSSVGITKSNSQ